MPVSAARFRELAASYPRQRLALVGDFCLDRYFEIDPARAEVSLETGLAVHNVTRVRCQPGAAGTVLNNLAALGIGELHLAGFAGDDGEGFELRRALEARRGVRLERFLRTALRQTFTYSKPLVMHAGRPPEELNRLDQKNWTPTPATLEELLASAVRELAGQVDAFILLDQVDVKDTGVVTTRLLATVGELARARPDLLIVADSRRGLGDFPPLTFKMNGAELGKLAGKQLETVDGVRDEALRLARSNGQRVFVTLAERGMIGASPRGESAHVPSWPVRGEIDIVGAGDAVTANLTAALAAGAALGEAMAIAQAAASIVIHQLGTTGTASAAEIAALLSRAI
jgi:rfaE bifunctional protein kinase chain/domain